MGANLNPGNPRTIRVVAAFEYETNDAAWDEEKSAHEEFRKYLHQKEWFKIHWKTVNDWFLSQGAKHRQEVSVKP